MGYGVIGSGTNRFSGGIATANTIYNFEFGNRYLKDLDTETMIISTTTLNPADFGYQDVYELRFFNENNTDWWTSLSGIRVYYCQIYDNDVLMRDLIPCYNKNTNVIGVYDIVNGSFYTNDGPGSLLAGPDV